MDSGRLEKFKKLAGMMNDQTTSYVHPLKSLYKIFDFMLTAEETTGALETIATILGMQRGVVLPTLHYKGPWPAAPLPWQPASSCLCRVCKQDRP